MWIGGCHLKKRPEQFHVFEWCEVVSARRMIRNLLFTASEVKQVSEQQSCYRRRCIFVQYL